MHTIDTVAQELIARRRLPRATYRIQFHPGFTLTDATAIVAYLHDLGVSEAYASPLFTARAGSTHGYDVCDYGQLSPALGGEEAFADFSKALRAHDMGLILDMVPNHMGIGNGNPWWMDVLEHGPSSSYATFFDIDWEPVKQQLAGKVLLPILGDQYGVVLENGELQLDIDEGAFIVRYYETWLPVAPRTAQQVLDGIREQIVELLPEDDAERQELESINTALSYLPARDETDPERLAERRRESGVIRRRFAALYERSADVRAATAATLLLFNGSVGDPRSFDRLDSLLQAQPYRLAFWRVAAEEINYRRFFDINDLAAVRVELPEVFEKTHELVFRLATEGVVSGLRIDHPDGLWDPPAYFRQLQERYLLAQLAHQPNSTLAHNGGAAGSAAMAELDVEAAAVRAWALQHAEHTAAGEGSWPLYVVVEKILSESEPLPPDWAVDGTTGYDFLNLANGVFMTRSISRLSTPSIVALCTRRIRRRCRRSRCLYIRRSRRLGMGRWPARLPPFRTNLSASTRRTVAIAILRCVASRMRGPQLLSSYRFIALISPIPILFRSAMCALCSMQCVLRAACTRASRARGSRSCATPCCCATCTNSAKKIARPGSMWGCGCNRSPARGWPRASRTRLSTATIAWCRSTRLAGTPSNLACP
ncbi:hypothetical protein HC891_10630 [Candidatus Gracilibacteria bacterium]|nr:hypothetical protein [Candidatus Gracilibacteria bacterium]